MTRICKKGVYKTGVKLLIIVAVLVASAFALSSCRMGENGEIYLYCYGDYFDTMILEDFEEETGISVILDSYDTAEEMYTVIKNSDGGGYDLICTSDYMIEKMISEDMLSELDKENIPALKNMDAKYMAKAEEFDPGNKYAVPYAMGTLGILYNKNMVGDEDVNSWSILWNEKFADQIVMPDSVRDDYAIALSLLGYDINTSDKAQVEEATELLIEQKPLVYRYANDSARDLLADGSAALGVVWSGEYAYTLDLNPDVGYSVPAEGSEFFIDAWVVPKQAANKAAAEKFINFMCKAKVAAENFDYLYYTTPNEAAKKYIDREALGMEALFPSDETLSRCTSLHSLKPEVMDMYSKNWKKVKSE